MDLKTGVILNGKYRIVRLVDERGVGAVYEGRRMAGDGRVAIKVLKRKFAADHEWIARFEREAQVASRISSPRLARFIEVGEVDRRRFMVMEYLQGEKLSTRMERERRIAPAVMVDLIQQLLEALEKVHQAGVVHRAISPQSVFLQQMGRVDYVCLLDFGVCKDMTDHLRDLHTAQSRLLGAVAYAAPETMLGGSRKADPRSDLFSVGVLLYRGISGLAPFPAREPGELLERLRRGPAEPLMDAAPEVDRALSAIVDRALAFSPNDRFQTATELRAALYALSAKKPPAPAAKIVVRPKGAEARAPQKNAEPRAPQKNAVDVRAPQKNAVDVRAPQKNAAEMRVPQKNAEARAPQKNVEARTTQKYEEAYVPRQETVRLPESELQEATRPDLGSAHDTLTVEIDVEALAAAHPPEDEDPTITKELEKKAPKLATKTVRMSIAPPLPQEAHHRRRK